MFRDGPVKYESVVPGLQRHGRLFRHLGLQLPHLLRRQVGRIGDDEIQLPFGQGLPVGKEVALHRLRSAGSPEAPIEGRCLKGRSIQHIFGAAALPLQGQTGVLFEVGIGLRAFFHAGNDRCRAEPLDAEAQTAGSSAKIQYTRRFHACQHPGSSFGHHLGVGAGAEHPRPYSQLKVEEGPAAAEVLQRLPSCAAEGQRLQSGRFVGVQRAVCEPGVPACGQPEQLPGVEVRVGTACRRQTLFHFPDGGPGQHPFAHHVPSSGFSGKTGVTAAMATSIMLSSGSKTVSRCTQRPGWRMMRVARLSERPHHFSSS